MALSLSIDVRQESKEAVVKHKVAVIGAGNVGGKRCFPGKPGVCRNGVVCETADVPGVGGCL